MTAIQAGSAQQFTDLFQEWVKRTKNQGLVCKLYPETGPLRRELYPKHMEFFKLGQSRMARMASGGNSIGKTLGLGGYETAVHLTGLYPDWWPGHRFKKPTRWWASGSFTRTTRDYQQRALLGQPSAEKRGGGLIPVDCIDFDSLRRIQGGAGAIDFVRIRHASGGWSHLGFKSYEQGLDAFFGETLDCAWLDEPCPIDIYSEVIKRFRGAQHPMCILTFTPMHGQTELTQMFMDTEDDSRAIVFIDWDDVPHLSEKYKQETLANTPRHLRVTVKSGVPAMAEGAVYPVPEDRFVISPLQSIPSHWKRICGFDGGWHNTAAGWFAIDPDSDVAHLYSEHKQGEMAVPMHAAAIKARGAWIPIIGDAGATSEVDGKHVRKEYANSGVRILKADKAVSAGTNAVLTRLMTGRLKVYSTCTEWLREYRAYRYKNGKILKVNDHLMDMTRYALHGGLKHAKSQAEVQAWRQAGEMREITFGRRY